MPISRRSLLTIAGAGAVAAALDVVVPALRPLVAWAAADTPGRGLFGGVTTLDRTVVKSGTVSPKGYRKIVPADGEPHVLREEFSLGRFGQPTVALAAFAQMTDLHVVDDQSPLRVEFTDRQADPPNTGGFPTASAYRAHESLSTHVVDAMARALRNIGWAPMTGLPLAFTMVTGDVVDNVQYNEVRWYIDLLDGGQSITPDSGAIGVDESVTGTFGVPGLLGEVHDPAYWYSEASQYTLGLSDNYQTTWDFPVLPGFLAAARRQYTSTGLGMPWYAAMGNHDGTVQGNLPVDPSGIEGCLLPSFMDMAVGNQKPYKSYSPLPANPGALDVLSFVNDFAFGIVSPDQRRHLLKRADFAREHFNTTTAPAGHGFSPAGDTYYLMPPAADADPVRYITLDTVNYHGRDGGQIDGYQFLWLEAVLQSFSSRYYDTSGNVVTRSGVTDKLVVVFCHHTIDTINNRMGDPPPVPPTDPRLRFYYGDDLRKLLLRYPNVILLVNGHTHANKIIPHDRQEVITQPATGGFWEINTASHIDWPAQSRLIEIAAGGGYLSIFTTMVDIDAPADASNDLRTPAVLASIGRELAANDPQKRDGNQPTDSTGSQRGAAGDRNTQLLLPMPFALPTPTFWGSPIGLGCHSDGRLEAWGTDGADQIWQRYQPTAGSDAWTGWGIVEGSLRVTAIEADMFGRLGVYGANSNGEVWYTRQLAQGGWSQWASLGVVSARSIAVARNADGHMEIFVSTATGDVSHIWESTPGSYVWGAWSTGFGNPGFVPFNRLASLHNVDGRVQVFGITPNGEIWYRTQIATGGWTNWAGLNHNGGVRVTALAAAVNLDGRMILYGVDPDRRVVWTAQTAAGASDSWTPWALLDNGASRMTQLAARRKGTTNTIELYGIDVTGHVWNCHQSAPNGTDYTAWTDTGGNLRPDAPGPLPATTVGNPPPKTVIVPNVMNQTPAGAQAMIEAAGLVYGTPSKMKMCIALNTVQNQSPNQGDVVPAGTVVTVTIDIGTAKDCGPPK